MEKGERFSEYLFAKMGPGDGGTKTTEDRMAPFEPTGVKKWFIDNTMLVITLIGVISGVAVGFGLRPYGLGPDALMIISYPGELFMRLLKLMILPLIIASLIAGSASLNAKMSGKIAVRTLLYFILTSMFNAALGILVATLIHPGKPDLRDDSVGVTIGRREHSILDSLLDIGRNIFPDNIVQAAFQQAHTVYAKPPTIFAENASESDTLPALVRVVSYRSGTNTLGLVFFCLVFGSLLGTLGPKGKVVIDFFQAIFEVIMKMVTGVMWLTPLGVSSVIAGKILGVSNVGQVMSQLAWFIATVAIGVFFYQLIVMQLIYFIALRKNPYKFYWGLSHAMLTASATASTTASDVSSYGGSITHRPSHHKVRSAHRVQHQYGRHRSIPRCCQCIHLPDEHNSIGLCTARNYLSDVDSGVGVVCVGAVRGDGAAAGGAGGGGCARARRVAALRYRLARVSHHHLASSDRIRTTNNMLGDCYAAAVVEHLSKNELMACDAISNEPVANGTTPTLNTEVDLGIVTPSRKSIASDDVIIDMHFSGHHCNSIKRM
ncbi:unnamed protein product [Diatraea saccharalis]|uniref:Amino acid transporter n=1 Tax=Diatraea saccharalis TaxID=40085 RepID=A0A9N9QYD8_9NEOP|nr:unnamed protein product [Diatraea saccharalis]